LQLVVAAVDTTVLLVVNRILTQRPFFRQAGVEAEALELVEPVEP
jgi:hypothetical protein